MSPKRPPEDDACEDLLIDHEAERLDVTTKAQNQASAIFHEAARQIVELLRTPNPGEFVRRRAQEIYVKAMLVALGGTGNAVRDMVRRQAEERREVFGHRSGRKLCVAPITKKGMAERKARIEEAREIERKDPPEE